MTAYSFGELYPEVVDAGEDEGGVPSRLIKTDRRKAEKEGTPWQMFAGSPSVGRTTDAVLADADDHQQAELVVFAEAHLDVDAVQEQVGVAVELQAALLERGVVGLPTLGQALDRARRQPQASSPSRSRSAGAKSPVEQIAQRRREVSRRADRAAPARSLRSSRSRSAGAKSPVDNPRRLPPRPTHSRRSCSKLSYCQMLWMSWREDAQAATVSFVI
jgi:hypothetical protein